MGTPDFSVPILEKLVLEQYKIVLVVTQPDRPKGRKRKLTPSPVKEFATKEGLPVFQPHKLSDNFEAIKAAKPDLIITAAYGQLLPKELLELPTYGCINVHASLLPELRGGAPIHYAILQGKKQTGITIMFMEEKLDAGAILTQESVEIETDDHVGMLHDKLSHIGAVLLIKTLPKLFKDELTPTEQNEEEATFAPNISREEEEIDWNQTNETIYNHIRGLRPWPVAFTLYEGRRMKLWWSLLDEETYQASPGEIVKMIDEEKVVVACGNKKAIHITEIQPSGKKRMTVREYLRGDKNRFKVGMKMGE